jgi:hypothetical protein
MRYKAFISYSHAADSKLAPALQSGLQQLARPWYTLRAISVYRDKSSLAANSGLKQSLQDALEASEFLILMASPEAAKSPWVAAEVEYWRAHRSPEKLLIVLTNGELSWNPQNRIQYGASGPVLPEPLERSLQQEPLYVDLRWAKEVDHLSLRNSQFRSDVLDLAATLHGVPKDELDGEDVRQHHRFKILTRLTICVLTVLLLAALGLSVIAIGQTQEARRKSAEAERWAERRLFTTSVMLEQQVEGTRFSTILKNWDGMGLTFGMRAWSQQNGGLGKLLRAFEAADPKLFTEVFGDGDPNLAAQLLDHTAKDKGGVDSNGKSTDPRFELTDQAWVDRFEKAANTPKFQAVQLNFAYDDFHAALHQLSERAPNIRTERGIAFMLDLVTQSGPNSTYRMFKKVTSSQMPESEVLSRMQEESVASMRLKQFTEAIRRRRELFRTTPLLLDEPVVRFDVGQRAWIRDVRDWFNQILHRQPSSTVQHG